MVMAHSTFITTSSLDQSAVMRSASSGSILFLPASLGMSVLKTSAAPAPFFAVVWLILSDVIVALILYGASPFNSTVKRPELFRRFSNDGTAILASPAPPSFAATASSMTRVGDETIRVSVAPSGFAGKAITLGVAGTTNFSLFGGAASSVNWGGVRDKAVASMIVRPKLRCQIVFIGRVCIIDSKPRFTTPSGEPLAD